MDDQRPRLPVLVVDDDPDVRRLLAEQLAEGYVVALAGTADEAIQWLGARRGSPAVVILDLILPDSGFRVLEYLQWAGRRVPVIVHTGHAEMAETVRRQRLAPVVAVLIKPVERETLLAQVAAAARRA